MKPVLQAYGLDIGCKVASMARCAIALLITIGWLGIPVPFVDASHQRHESHQSESNHQVAGPGYPIAGASFRVYRVEAGKWVGGEDQADMTVRTVLDAFAFLMEHRIDYPRFDEAMKNNALANVVIEPIVVNRDGKVFPFLVARTEDPGRVNLLISASMLKEKGYLGQSEKLVPTLAREFQWVVSKADTAPKPTIVSTARDVEHAPIRVNREIRGLSGEERERILQRLFASYLRTVDDFKSLEGQPSYEMGTEQLVQPIHSDSTTKFYEIRVREALQMIVREPYFEKRTPKAVRSLLNGRIWNVSFVKIDQRDWATRTRVLSEDQSVVVGETGRRIQPATILVNTYRKAAPDDPYYEDTKGLPMGALTTGQLARVIAWEVEQNIIEKSMKGHVAQDELTAPK